jgi:hypothetical protein
VVDDATDDADEAGLYATASAEAVPDGDNGARSTRSKGPKEGCDGEAATFWVASDSSWEVGLLGEAACGNGFVDDCKWVAETTSWFTGDPGDRGGVCAFSGIGEADSALAVASMLGGTTMGLN